MRYTTVIDISEMPSVYRNHNARLLYIHMALKCGYHDDDRDVLNDSIRTLALRSGLTVSATRHALGVLQAASLITKEGTAWRVRKWVMQADVTPRLQPKKAKPKEEDNDLVRRQELQIEEYRRKVNEAVNDMAKSDLMEWLKELQEGRSLRHHGVQMAANEQNITWLKKQIEKR